MKAIILCGEGEEGLAPLTLERPLPLLSLFDKPLLAHQAGLLRRHGVREIGVALPRLSRMVEDAMGDGEELGVRFTWLPAGAGSWSCWRPAPGFSGRRTPWCSGGGLGDLDLSALLAFHQVHRSAATWRWPTALRRRPGAGVLRRGGAGGAAAGRPQAVCWPVRWKPACASSRRRPGPGDRGGTLAGRLSALLDRGGPVRGSPGGAVAGAHRRRSLSGRWPTLCRASCGCGGTPRTAPGVWSASPLPPSVQVVPPAISVPASRWGRAPAGAPRCWRAPRWAAG
ncbi:MAG: NDP-sugar synthase [Flavonifractor plautii]